MMETLVKAYTKTDLGKKRKNNEDSNSYYIPTQKEILKEYGSIFIVADGVGGNANGEIASKLTCSTIIKTYYLQSKLLSIDQRLKKAIEKTNELIIKKGLELNTPDMATTVTAIVVTEMMVYVANVGDSRTYLINPARKELIQQITNDHSLVESQVRKGLLSKNEAEKAVNKNIITRAIGMDRTIAIDLFKVPWLQGDKYFLTTDGLTRVVHDSTIAEAITKFKPNDALNELIEIGNEKGGPDNMTICLVEKQKPSLLPYYIISSSFLVLALVFLLSWNLVSSFFLPYPTIKFQILDEKENMINKGLVELNINDKSNEATSSFFSSTELPAESKSEKLNELKKSPNQTFNLTVHGESYEIIEFPGAIKIFKDRKIGISKELWKCLAGKDKLKKKQGEYYLLSPFASSYTFSFKRGKKNPNLFLYPPISSENPENKISDMRKIEFQWDPFIDANDNKPTNYKLSLYRVNQKEEKDRKEESVYETTVSETTFLSSSIPTKKDLDPSFIYGWKVSIQVDGKKQPKESDWGWIDPIKPLGKPKLRYPEKDSKEISINPTFQWDKVEGADGYYLSIKLDTNNANPDWICEGIDLNQKTEIKFSDLNLKDKKNLECDQKYLWTVNAVKKSLKKTIKVLSNNLLQGFQTEKR